MPRIEEAPIRGYLHCRNPHCSGNTQEQVDAIRVTTYRTFRDVGSNIPGDENSWDTFRLMDEADRPCKACGHGRELTDQRRPVYQPLSAGLAGAPPGGFSQDGLLQVPAFNPRSAAADDDRVAALQAELSALKARLS